MYGVRYRLPSAFHTRVRNARIAIVDDALSARSALLGTYAELQTYGGVPVVAGALVSGLSFDLQRRERRWSYRRTASGLALDVEDQAG